MKTTHFLPILLALVMAGCGGVKRAERIESYFSSPASDKTGMATLHYIGCGGFLLDYAGEQILADPYFSNAPYSRVFFGKLRSDTALIGGFFQQKLGWRQDTLGSVSAILIAHSHYDHLADVPALLQNNLETGAVKVYGSNTMVNLLRSFPRLLPDTAKQLVDLDSMFPPENTPGASPFFHTPGRRIRFAAIPSEHAPHYSIFGSKKKLPYSKGNVQNPRKKPAKCAKHFKEGQSYNYMIDLLDEGGEPVFRIFSNAGSACNAGIGYPPAYLLEEKPVDMLLICGASYSLVDNYPFGLLEHLRPRMLFVMHWENFFKPAPKLQIRPATVPLTNIPKLMKSLEDIKAWEGYPEVIWMEKPMERGVGF